MHVIWKEILKMCKICISENYGTFLIAIAIQASYSFPRYLPNRKKTSPTTEVHSGFTHKSPKLERT